MNILSNNWCCMNCIHINECSEGNEEFNVLDYCANYECENPPMMPQDRPAEY